MSDERADIRAGFIRQRRNLMAVSLVVLALHRTGLTVATISILGNQVNLIKPLALTAPLWIAWSYLLIRYYQHFRDLQDRGFEAAFHGRLMHFADLRAIKYATTRYKVDAGDLKHPSVPSFDLRPVLQSIGLLWVYNYGGSVTVSSSLTNTSLTQVINDYSLAIPDRYMWPARIRATWWVIVHTRLFTEYVLPFVVALTPVVAAAAGALAA